MNSNSVQLSIGVVLSLLLNLWTTSIANGSGTSSVSAPTTYDNTSVNGTITCNSSVQAGPTALATGTINVVADGKGNLTSGNASYRGGPGASKMACNYALSRGTYTVQSDGSGQATTNWSLISQNSSPNCAATVSQSGISFSLKQASFSAPTSASRKESGNCKLAASASNGAQ
jgi:hypothetical protein